MTTYIGVTVSKDYENNQVSLPCDYVNAVSEAGGIAWIVPLLPPGNIDESIALSYLQQMDGLLLSGGVDVAPRHFGEEPRPGLGPVSPERDEMELALARAALRLDKPVLAICRGMQVLNVAAGGDVYQDVGRQVEGALQHRQKAPRWHAAHSVSVRPGTQCREILCPQGEDVWVNTLHHQAVREAAEDFVISARAADGVAEAMESSCHSFMLGVQWHPELMYRHSESMRRLFEAFICSATPDEGGGEVC